jgi:hypothetical protein
MDSICIVQDDPQDWIAESSKMAQVYQNAFLTLGATSAANSTSGLFDVENSSVPILDEILGVSGSGKLYHY